MSTVNTGLAVSPFASRISPAFFSSGSSEVKSCRGGLLVLPNIFTAPGYSQDWLRGDEVSERDQAHPHEGLRLADKSGWVAVGQTISENPGRVNIFYNHRNQIYSTAGQEI